MAEHTKLITIDPNGDTLLKLKDIRWELPEWIDEATRFAPTVDIFGFALDDTASECANESDQRENPEEVHFLVSSRQLRLVSTYFDMMFEKNFAESVADFADGRYHIWATEWNPKALERLMNIAHARSVGVAEYTLDELVEMALIIDYYDVHEAPYDHVKDHISGTSTGYCAPAPKTAFGSKVIKWMFLSYVFQQDHVLETATELAKKHSKGPVQDLGLPLGDIPEKLEEHRQQAIRSIVNQLDSLIERLGDGNECCSFECRASLLGSLIIFKRSGGLTSAAGGSIVPPYNGMSLQQACAAVRVMITRKHTGIYGRLDQTYAPVGACQKCDFGGLFDRIMKKVDEDLVFKLDLRRSKLVKFSD